MCNRLRTSIILLLYGFSFAAALDAQSQITGILNFFGSGSTITVVGGSTGTFSGIAGTTGTISASGIALNALPNLTFFTNTLSSGISTGTPGGTFVSQSISGVVYGQAPSAQFSYRGGFSALFQTGVRLPWCAPPSALNCPFTGNVFDLPNYSGSLTVLSVTLVDPIPTFPSPLSGVNFIDDGNVANASILAGSGRAVQGLAADGTARVLVRILATSIGQTFVVSVVKEDGQTLGTPPLEGGIATIAEANSGAFQSTAVATAVATSGSGNPVAFLVYRAPIDFVRPNNPADQAPAAARRQVFLNVQPENGTAIQAPIVIVRPPVILIHGFTGEPAVWANFQPVTSDSRLSVSIVDYSGPVAGDVSYINGIFPPVIGLFVSPLRKNMMGFVYNSKDVLEQIKGFIGNYAYPANGGTSVPVAVAQADIIAHSMGGLVTRIIPRAQWTSYYVPENWNQGYIHKVITIATPNLGSPLASATLLPRNVCSAWGLAMQGEAPIRSATIDGIAYEGGTESLCDTCNNGGMSDSLIALHRPAPLPSPMRIARVGGIMGASLYDAMTGSLGQIVSNLICLPLSPGYATDDIPQNYSALGWPMLMKGPSDGIVPVGSAADQFFLNVTAADGITWFNAIHGPGTLDLFPGMLYLTQQPTNLPARALALLNTPISDSVFVITQ
jgi:hypothetical protein